MRKKAATYEESLLHVSELLSQRRTCIRCARSYTQLGSIGRLQCAYHPQCERERTAKCVYCETYRPPASSVHGVRRSIAYVSAAGCVSVDHVYSESDARAPYVVMPYTVWCDVPNLRATQANHIRGRASGVCSMFGEPTVLVVGTVHKADHFGLRLHLFDTPSPYTLTLADAYDECAALFNYAPLHESSASSTLDEYAPTAQLGDASARVAVAQRLLFDVDALDEMECKVPYFVPFVIVLRVEVERIEIVECTKT